MKIEFESTILLKVNNASSCCFYNFDADRTVDWGVSLNVRFIN